MKRKFKEIKRFMVKEFEEIKARIYWIFHYKKINQEMNETSLELDLMQLTLKQQTINIAQEKNNLLHLRDERIQQLNVHISNQRNEIKKLAEKEKEYSKTIENLSNLLEEKELCRRITAGKVGGLKKYNNRLQEELIVANKKIDFLKNNRRSPSKEEIMAYEYNYKEVLKRNNDNTRKN